MFAKLTPSTPMSSIPALFTPETSPYSCPFSPEPDLARPPQVFTQHDWLVAWDHIFSREPSFLLSVVVAYNVVSQPALHRCKTADDIGVRLRSGEEGSCLPRVKRVWR